MRIRAISDGDVEAVLRLNDEAVWALSPLDADGLARHRAGASHLMVCELDDAVAAFAIAYAPGAAYGSVNYAWHTERFDDFLYLDRIAVSKDFRRRGIASALYDRLEASAVPHRRMVCEVNSTPPNEESLAFHDARGYRRIGFLTQRDGHETVMLEKPL
ncbi:MAG: GNAT family N-acetyltransferase [Actinomycetota bacterium]|nr:GNAT family N-acetyltransferase [Actinomycetota bacterium]